MLQKPFFKNNATTMAIDEKHPILCESVIKV